MAKEFSFKSVDRGWNDIRKTVKTLSHGGAYVKAGIIGSAANSQHAVDTGAPLTTLDVAMIQEFGSSDGHVPERSFIRAGFEANRAKYGEFLRKHVPRVYEGKATVEQVLQAAGLRMEADIRNYVTQGTGVPPPNAPSTVEKKGSSRPLVDSGLMIRSVGSAVVLKPGRE